MIKKVEIENFKCFIEKSIGFEDLTVLSGVNAVGKSSTIQVLLLCIQNMKKMNGIYNENSNNYLSLKSTLRVLQYYSKLLYKLRDNNDT